jgi:hypothetical protein
MLTLTGMLWYICKKLTVLTCDNALKLHPVSDVNCLYTLADGAADVRGSYNTTTHNELINK